MADFYFYPTFGGKSGIGRRGNSIASFLDGAEMGLKAPAIIEQRVRRPEAVVIDRVFEELGHDARGPQTRVRYRSAMAE